MVEGIETLSSSIIVAYNSFIELLPMWMQNFINFFILVLIIVVYSLFIWKFYSNISKKSPIGLDLNKYNQANHPFTEKLFAGIFYFIEYILISPFIIFLFFSVFTLFLILLSAEQNISQILIISATIIAAIRMTAYYKENLSQDLAKMLPLTLLSVAVLNPSTFSNALYFEGIINLLKEIPSFAGQAFYYLFFIILLEVIMRFFHLFTSLFHPEETVKKQEDSGK